MKQVSVVSVGLLLIHGVAVGDPLSDEDIDRHISALPIMIDLFRDLRDKLGSNPKTAKIISDAPLKSGFRTIIDTGKNERLGEYNSMEKIALEHDFESIEEWALVNDRVETLFLHAANIAVFPAPYGKNSGITKDTDIFAYINDETKPENIRQRISESFVDVCEEYCVEPSDLESVSRRYSDLLIAYNKIRK